MLPVTPSSKSFMYTKNKLGPSTDPCGTPLKTDFQLETSRPQLPNSRLHVCDWPATVTPHESEKKMSMNNYTLQHVGTVYGRVAKWCGEDDRSWDVAQREVPMAVSGRSKHNRGWTTHHCAWTRWPISCASTPSTSVSYIRDICVCPICLNEMTLCSKVATSWLYVGSKSAHLTTVMSFLSGSRQRTICACSCASANVLCDGTFKIAPTAFHQLYALHVIRSGNSTLYLRSLSTNIDATVTHKWQIPLWKSY